MNNYDDLKNKFNSLLVEYLNTFNIIELNVGLCIRYLSGLDIQNMDNKISKMSCESKIEYLLKLTSSDDDKKDIYTWCQKAHEKRHERNMYMHGQWRFIPHLEENVELRIAPWVVEKYKDIYPGTRITLQNLEDIVLDIKDCFKQFNVLRTKHGI
jgi:hypothetical protein